jgi:Protein of unknown function (DUF4019)
MRPYCSIVIAFLLSACATSKPAILTPDGSATPDGSVAVASATTPPHSSEPASGSNVAAATSAAQAWLALVDQDNYGASWEAAAPLFQKAVSRDQWAAQVGSARGPLGKLASRKLLSAQYTTSLPGVGEGQYVVIRYAADYENMPQAIETITPMMSPEGAWRVAGYFIK